MIFVGIPTYDGQVQALLALGLMQEATLPNTPLFSVGSRQSSLLARNFNLLWCHVLNNRATFTHFLLIHADIIPEQGFIKKMTQEMIRTGADVLGVVIPLKDSRGLTSTGVIDDSLVSFQPTRLSIRELPLLPRTFGVKEVLRNLKLQYKNPALLVNTGLLLVDMRKPWVEKVCFEIEDKIIQGINGRFSAQTISEDWNFSLQAAKLGANVKATKEVKVSHIGVSAFPNHGNWGTMQSEAREVSNESAL